MKLAIQFILIACLLLTGASLAHAGPGGFGDGRRMQPPGMGKPGGPMARMARFEKIRVAKLMELLELNADEETEFKAVFRKMRKKVRQLEREKKGLLEALSDMARNDQSDNDEIRQTLDRLHDIEREKVAMHEEFLKFAEEELTIRQLAKLHLFHARFESAILRKLRMFRGGPGPHGMGGGRPPMDWLDSGGKQELFESQ